MAPLVLSNYILILEYLFRKSPLTKALALSGEDFELLKYNLLIS